MAHQRVPADVKIREARLASDTVTVRSSPVRYPVPGGIILPWPLSGKYHDGATTRHGGATMRK